jgi:hypothetical protein
MIEQERCRIPLGTPRPLEEECTDMQTGVHSVLAGLGLTELQWTTELVESWPMLVGKQVSRHTRPGRMYGAELIVYVDSSVWMQELSRYGIKGLLAKVQEKYGCTKVKSIRLQLDPDGRLNAKSTSL